MTVSIGHFLCTHRGGPRPSPDTSLCCLQPVRLLPGPRRRGRLSHEMEGNGRIGDPWALRPVSCSEWDGLRAVSWKEGLLEGSSPLRPQV